MKRFSHWTITEVEEEFGVRWQHPNAIPQSFLNAEGVEALSQTEIDNLERLQTRLIEHRFSWNEKEQEVKLIVPLLEMAEFDQDTYRSFWGRRILATHNDERIFGDVDFIVATGRWSPERPYFFLHQYKRYVDSVGDPMAQILVTMLAAQTLNEGHHPIHGVYVVDSYWHFVFLDDQKYAVSPAYSAARDEIRDILCILKKMRLIIEEQIRQDG